MRTWTLLLSGLLVWAVHFFILYGIGEFAGSDPASRIAVAAMTAICLAACALLAWAIARAPQQDGFGQWRARLALAGLGLGAIAVIWQGFPALLAR